MVEYIVMGARIACGLLGFASVMMGVVMLVAFVVLLIRGKVKITDYDEDDGGRSAVDEGRTTLQRSRRRA